MFSLPQSVYSSIFFDSFKLIGKWIVVSMDALFGLCRKKATGSSVRPPLNDGLMFEDQDKVISYIQSYQSQSVSDQGKVKYMQF